MGVARRGGVVCFPAMTDLEAHIEMARRHVAEGRRIVKSQHQRMAEGKAGQDGEDFLNTLEQSLAIFEDDLQRLLKEREAG